VQDFWNILTSDSALPFSLLLIPFGIYWVIFSFGFIDLDLDADIDIESDGTADGGSNPGLFHTVMAGVLRFMNAKDVPIMLVLTLIALFTWVAVMLSSILLPEIVPFRNTVIAIGGIIVGTLLTRFLSKPLSPLFQFIKTDEPSDPIIGKSGTVRSHELTDKSRYRRLHGQRPQLTQYTHLLLNNYHYETTHILRRN